MKPITRLLVPFLGFLSAAPAQGLPEFNSLAVQMPADPAASAGTFQRLMPARIGPDPDLDLMALVDHAGSRDVAYMPNPLAFRVLVPIAQGVRDMAVVHGGAQGNGDVLLVLEAAGLGFYEYESIANIPVLQNLDTAWAGCDRATPGCSASTPSGPSCCAGRSTAAPEKLSCARRKASGSQTGNSCPSTTASSRARPDQAQPDLTVVLGGGGEPDLLVFYGQYLIDVADGQLGTMPFTNVEGASIAFLRPRARRKPAGSARSAQGERGDAAQWREESGRWTWPNRRPESRGREQPSHAAEGAGLGEPAFRSVGGAAISPLARSAKSHALHGLSAGLGVSNPDSGCSLGRTADLKDYTECHADVEEWRAVASGLDVGGPPDHPQPARSRDWCISVNWLALATPLVVLLLVIAALLRRRLELRHFEANVAARVQAKDRGSHRARLQHPKIDLANCIGCGACVRACPEDGVLELAYGQAVVVHGARCVGHGLCATACPTNAIALTLGDLKDRRDLPAVDEKLEAVGVPGLFLAGEITGFALVRTAVQHGTLVAREVAARVGQRQAADEDAAEPGAKGPLDLLVVGLGPAGLACLLAAKEAGLRCYGIDQAAEVGGTVAAYPRKKLVMTQPVELPLHGKLSRLEYAKEELVELWQGLAKKHRLPVKTGTVLQTIEKRSDGTFAVATSNGTVRARHVCLAVGRRGSPQKLGVPGEDLPKVSYSLLDAESYQDKNVLVVGGGDSAIEAALALAEQPGNTVTVSYRKEAFTRLKARNEERITAAIAAGHVLVQFGSTVAAILPDQVQLNCPSGEGGGAATMTLLEVPNDEVFIFAGGTPPFPLLEAAGVSFDPELRPKEADPAADRGTGLLVALAATLVGLVVLLFVRLWYGEYYDLAVGSRPGSGLHDFLRPQGTLGLSAGVAAVLLFSANLAYLLRRAGRWGSRLPGTLKSWMNMHVATGLAACLAALLHSGYQLRESAGGHALLAMVVVVGAGVLGRWFYAFVPRAQNGRQQDLEELRGQVAAIAGEWDTHGRGFGSDVRTQVENLASASMFGKGFLHRVAGLVRSQWRLRRQLAQLQRDARAEGIPADEAKHLVALAQRSHKLALQLSHFEEVRGILSVWRWLHRWLALLLLLLTIVHVVTAMRYGGVDFRVLPGMGGSR